MGTLQQCFGIDVANCNSSDQLLLMHNHHRTQCAYRSTRSEIEPSIQRLNVEMPRLPITINVACVCSARWTMCSAGWSTSIAVSSAAPLLLPVHVRGQSFAHSVLEHHRELHLALFVPPVLADESPRKSEAWTLRLAPSKMRYLWPVGIEESRHRQREWSQRLVSRGWSLLLLNAF